jgi:dTDP-4-dehydrorhamnose reductase
MKVLVTGAAGMLGRDVVLAAGNAGHDVVGFGRTELDVTDAAAVERKLEQERPDVVVNSAAWTDVDGAEESEEDATAVNGAGAGNIAAAAAGLGASVVYVSSDYVFDGAKGSPYVETDQTAPLSAYGRSKLAGEGATAAANKRHFIVRSAWLFGIGGRNFVETMLRLAADHGEVLVVRDQVGSPTYTWHLAYGIVRLIEGVEFGIHHMAAAGACSWYEFAREIFDQAKIECKVLSATTEMLGRPAPRPPYSALTSQREHAIELPSWQDGLAAYLAQRRAEMEAAA